MAAADAPAVATDTSWHAAFTAVPPYLEFRHGPFGFSGYARSDIPAGAVLLSLRYSRALNELYAADTAVGRAAAPLVAAHPSRLSGRNVLYLAMVAEAADPDAARAPFGPYLRSLPARFDDPLWWDATELRALAGTNLAAAVEFKRTWLRSAYDALFPALFEAHPTLFDRAVFTWERWLWAHSCFSSRGFPHALSVPPGHPSESAPPAAGDGGAYAAVEDAAAGGGGTVSAAAIAAAHGDGTPVGCMLPVLDILNHAYRTPVDWVRGAEADTTAGTGGGPHHPGGGCVSFVTRAPIPAGCEVFNNYGPKSNEELLLSFGFVLARNPQDTLALRVGTAAAAASSSGGGDLVAALRLPRRFVIRSQAGAYEAAGMGVGDGNGGASTSAAASLPSSSAPLLVPLYDARIVPAELLAVLRLGCLGPEPRARLAQALAASSSDAAASRESLRAALLAPSGCGLDTELRALVCLRDVALAKLRALLQAPPSAAAADGSGGDGSSTLAGLSRDWLAAELASPPDAAASGTTNSASPSTHAVPGHNDAALFAGPAGSVSSYRGWMARVYVSGQARLLLQLLGHVAHAAATLTGSGGVEAGAGGASSAQAALRELSALPPAARALLARTPGSVTVDAAALPGGSVGTREHAATVDRALVAVVGDSCDSGSGTAGRRLLSLPADHLLCPAHIPLLCPAAEAALATVGLGTAGDDDDNDGAGAPAPFDPDVAALQLAVTLALEAARQGRACGEGTTGGPSNDDGTPAQRAFRDWVAWARGALDVDAVGARLAAAAAAAATNADDATAGVADALASAAEEARQQYAALEPVWGAGGSSGRKRKRAAAAAATPPLFTEADFTWAWLIAQALAQPLAVRGAPQLAIPLLRVRLPCVPPLWGSPLAAALEAAGARSRQDASPEGVPSSLPTVAAAVWAVEEDADARPAAVLRLLPGPQPAAQASSFSASSEPHPLLVVAHVQAQVAVVPAGGDPASPAGRRLLAALAGALQRGDGAEAAAASVAAGAAMAAPLLLSHASGAEGDNDEDEEEEEDHDDDGGSRAPVDAEGDLAAYAYRHRGAPPERWVGAFTAV